MTLIAVKLLLAPSFVVGASLAARRFGARVGGLIAGLPVVAGPILLAYALAHGRGFAAGAAAGTLLGLVSLIAFVVVYGRLAGRLSWGASMLVGWLAFAGLRRRSSAPSHPRRGGAARSPWPRLPAGLALLPRPRAGARTCGRRRRAGICRCAPPARSTLVLDADRDRRLARAPSSAACWRRFRSSRRCSRLHPRPARHRRAAAAAARAWSAASPPSRCSSSRSPSRFAASRTGAAFALATAVACSPRASPSRSRARASPAPAAADPGLRLEPRPRPAGMVRRGAGTDRARGPLGRQCSDMFGSPAEFRPVPRSCRFRPSACRRCMPG